MSDHADLITQARGGFPTSDEVANYPLEALVLIEALADALEAQSCAGFCTCENVQERARRDRAAAERAWDEGHEACSEFVDGPDWAEPPANPYRESGGK
jgi:hypothetical protein